MINSIVHAGGKGTRLRESYAGPKALAPVDGVPLLWYHLQPLIKSGLVSKFIFTLMHDHEVVQNYVENLVSEQELNTASIVEPRPLGRAGSVRYGIEAGLINVEVPCLMSHPDDLIPVDVKNLMEYAEESEKQGKYLIIVMAKNTVNPFGIGVTKENQDIIELRYFLEKPELPLIPNHYANTGMTLYMPDAMKAFKEAPLDRKTHAEDHIIPKLVKEGKVAVYLVERWLSVNYASEYDTVNEMGKEKLLEFLGV